MPTRDLGFDDLLAIRALRTLPTIALSPDGRYLASVVRREATYRDREWHDLPSGANSRVASTELSVTELATGVTRRLLGEEGQSWRPSWSPDGSALAFYADHTGVVNLWRWEEATGEVRVLSAAPIFSWVSGDTPRWSPDGARIYVPLRPAGWQPGTDEPSVGASEPAGGPAVDVLVSHAGETAAVVAAPSERDAPHLFRDIGVVDAVTGRTERLLTDFPTFGVFPSPDGRWLALTTLAIRPDQGHWEHRRELHLLPTTGGSPRLVAGDIEGTGFGPAWSPDGARLAFLRDGACWVTPVDGIGAGAPNHLRSSARLDWLPLLWHPSGTGLLVREGGTRLWCLPIDGSPPVPLSLPAGRGRVGVLQREGTTWCSSPDGESCVVNMREETALRGEIWRVPLDGGPPVRLLAEDRHLVAAFSGEGDGFSGDVSADGSTVAYIAEDETHPPEVWLANASFRERRQATNLNPHLDDVVMGRARLIAWRTTEGEKAHGALLLPPAYREGQRVPLIVSIYPGGAPSRDLHRWGNGSAILHPQLLAAAGYAVLHADVPGARSSAEGRHTWRLSRAGLAGAVLPGVNEVIRLGIADPTRLGLMGHSAGGLAVNRLLTETARFRAAVSSAGGGNAAASFGHLYLRPDGLPEYFGVHNEEQRNGGPPWAAPLRYLLHSPVYFLDRVETPLLLLDGTDDTAMGVERSDELFVGLRRLGKEAMLLRYRGEAHVPATFGVANRRDVARRVLDWFNQHLRQPLPWGDDHTR